MLHTDERYIDYATSMPMHDGQEICSFLDNLTNSADEKEHEENE